MTQNGREMENIDKLQEEIDELKDSMKKYAEDLTDEGKHKLSRLHEQLHRKHEELIEHYGPIFEKYRESGKEMVHHVEEKVAEKPLTALLLAFGAGIVIGSLCRGRRD